MEILNRWERLFVDHFFEVKIRAKSNDKLNIEKATDVLQTLESEYPGLDTEILEVFNEKNLENKELMNRYLYKDSRIRPSGNRLTMTWEMRLDSKEECGEERLEKIRRDYIKETGHAFKIISSERRCENLLVRYFRSVRIDAQEYWSDYLSSL